MKKKNICMPLTDFRGAVAKKYLFFKNYLGHNQAALKAIAELEQLYYRGAPFDLSSVKCKYEELLEAAYGAVYTLGFISRKDYHLLEGSLSRIDNSILEEMKPRYSYISRHFVLPFENIIPDLKQMVGAKAANLAFLKNELGLPVPDGFAVTTYAFEKFLEENDLPGRIENELSKILPESLEGLKDISLELQSMINDSVVPEYIIDEIMRAYHSLEDKTRKGVRIAMRSSSIGEDTDATFAGQYATMLNVTEENIIDAYKTVIASKYSERSVYYRLQHGFDDKETPMCVIGIAMIDSKASGVAYTGDSFGSDAVKINSIWGLGEYLVDGRATADTYSVEKKVPAITIKEIRRKEHMLKALDNGGTTIEEVPEDQKEVPSISDSLAFKITYYGTMLEEAFAGPQDIEWAADKDNNLYLLQARPLSISRAGVYKEAFQQRSPEHPLLISEGQTASGGIAAGKVFMPQEGSEINSVPENSILVTKTASPDYARLTGKINGIITDLGSITSHLASVAREFGIPFIAGAKNATLVLNDGELITMSASDITVYKGEVKELIANARPPKKLVFESPVHRRMRRILDHISPLNLTDSRDAAFSPEGCRTLHDIIRYTHEMGMKAMFGITDEAEEVRSIELSAKIPLTFRFIDLGGGLSRGLTTCHTVTPEHIESVPMKAIWRGLTHPGISWSGTISVDAKKLMTLFAVSAASGAGESPGGTSYAILSGEYMNLSAKFGYHFATIDALCSEISNQNYISLQFSGGAGNYYGKSLRISFLGNVLKKLGFQISLKGDLIEASLTGYDKTSEERVLDLIGRLLASSRLLDVAISDQGDVELLTNAFFEESYDFLSKRRDDGLRNFYTHGGYWKRMDSEGHTYCVQDGSKEYSIASGAAGIAGKFIGQKVQELLDNIEAYYYFPLAIAKNSEMSDGKVSVRVKPVRGHIDRAGGIAFGILNSSYYYVIRINALEDNIILFEYVNGKRYQRAAINEKIHPDRWCELSVEVRGKRIRGFLDGDPVIEYTADKDVRGFIGLWTKADSVTWFDALTVDINNKKKTIPF